MTPPPRWCDWEVGCMVPVNYRFPFNGPDENRKMVGGVMTPPYEWCGCFIF